MKKTLIVIAGITSMLSFNSCKKKGCMDELAANYSSESKKDDGTCSYEPTSIQLKFTQNFNGTDVTVNSFNSLSYTNANGEDLSITKLQYSISDVRFYLPNGDSVYVDGTYNLIDLENAASLTYDLPALTAFIGTKEFQSKFTGVGFNYGFDPADNTSGAYADLNLASWGWPDMIGGGYHQMKMEGLYLDATGTQVAYQYHNGSATKNANGDFESNYRFIKLDNSAFDLKGNTVIEIKMNIANWYTNPNTWDLNTLYTTLMPNYSAQIMMTQNAVDVFSVGEITH